MTLSIYLYNRILIHVGLMFTFLIIFFSTPSNALMTKHGKAILEKLSDYDLCHTRNNASYCQEALSDWVVKNPNDTFSAGKLTKKYMNPWVAISFFDKAWSIKIENCNDSDVEQAVISALGLPKDNNNVIVDQALNLAFKHCEKELSQKVADQAKVNSYILENSCKPLMAKKLLSGVSLKKCSKL